MKYSPVSYEESGKNHASIGGETRLESEFKCRLLLAAHQGRAAGVSWLPGLISPSTVNVLNWKFLEIFFSFLSSISLFNAQINSAWIWSYCPETNGCANHGRLSGIQVLLFKAPAISGFSAPGWFSSFSWIQEWCPCSKWSPNGQEICRIPALVHPRRWSRQGQNKNWFSPCSDHLTMHAWYQFARPNVIF